MIEHPMESYLMRKSEGKLDLVGGYIGVTSSQQRCAKGGRPNLQG
jgi:hypothetical protein